MSGNFGHRVNSDMHLQTVQIQMRRLSRIFTACLVNFLANSNNENTNQTRSQSEFA